MVKVLKDKELIEKFLTRGVEAIYPTKDELRQKLMSGERLRIYQGFDPSGPFLHIGHAMGIRALRILQQLGHEVIFLIGDYTARVGDPDKETGRKILTDEIIEKNRQGWKEQAAQIIDFEGDNPVLFKRNYEWLSKLTLNDLIQLMSKSTVQQMIERDMFDRRIKAGDPVGLQEFIYPLMQGYDGVAMQVDMEIGGTDQTFNMLMGRHLVKEYLGKEKFVRTNILMDAPDGRTMSKTKGNGINLSDSSEDMYGKAMSYSDSLITKGFKLLTEIPITDIEEMDKAMEKGSNPMEFKKQLAYEIVKILRSEKDAKSAQEHFEKTVQSKDGDVVTEIKKAIETGEEQSLAKVETNLHGKMSVLEFAKKAYDGKFSSAEIKRLIEQGGVEVDGNKISNTNQEIDFIKGTVIKIGKRDYTVIA
ncbi:MAG: tyrosyl-tRNA synthetase [uncultured bacterium]|nr:MAG: tyrosyl-tRNA synthetase [uncultured bacterium]